MIGNLDDTDDSTINVIVPFVFPESVGLDKTSLILDCFDSSYVFSCLGLAECQLEFVRRYG